MSTKILFPLVILAALSAAALSAAQGPSARPNGSAGGRAELPAEKRLRNVRRLTDGGENAEAYFSGDGRGLIFQSKRDGRDCDQIYTMRADGSGLRMVSTGEGTTTCSYLFPSGRRILYASTHLADRRCPAPPDRSRGYVWAVYPGFDIFSADPDGRNLRRLTSTPGYDAEATMSADGRRVVFTSVRDGDLDIYSMSPDGRDVRRLTSELGYDGGPFFSRDGRKIVYRAYHPKTPEQVARYRRLLSENVIEPANFEIWVMDADGRNKRRVTDFGAASFAPYFTPDGRRIIFSSNLENPRGRNFDLYLVNLDGTGLERVTYSEVFDGFPMFSPDGRRLVFASNRDAAKPGDTNVFIADWVEPPAGGGRVGGSLTDARGRPAAGARLVFEGRPARREALTDEEGRYEIELPDGVYRVTVSGPGFRTLAERVRVYAGETTSFGPVLRRAAGRARDPRRPRR